MIPAIASGGRSFQGAFAYYMHDKNASSTARIAWTQTMNMMTSCVDKAHKVMAYTAMAQQRLKEVTGQKLSGRKLEKPVFAYSLAWHPEQKPDKDAMLEAARQSLDALGLTEHEVAIAAHKDEPHRHIHIIVNRVNPVTGMAASLSQSRRKLSAWALEYERKTGKVYCMQREENHRKRQNGQSANYNDPVISEAWQRSGDAREFQSRLANKGYHLAQGRKRLVVVDPYDKAHNPVRYLKGIAKAAEFHERMDGLDHDKLPSVEAVIGQRKIERDKNAERLQEYEQRVAEALSKQFSQHYEEKEKLMDRHARRIDQKTHKLEGYYKLHEKQARIDQLTHRLENPNRIQKLAFKFFKTDRKLTGERGMLEKGKATAEQRLQEAVKPLELERDREIQSMDKRHARELDRLTEHLAGWKPRERDLSREWSQAAHERDMKQDRRHDGPELGR